jgi:hypothetical protein
LWFRSSRPTGDLHPKCITPCPAHKKKPCGKHGFIN